MKKNPVLIPLLVLSILFLNSPVSAEDEESENQNASGAVTAVSEKEIVISQDNDEGEKINVTYKITKETELKNADSIKDISKNMKVEIQFVVKNDQKIAKIINVIKDDDGENLEDKNKNNGKDNDDDKDNKGSDNSSEE